MVADFAQLHEDVENAEEAARLEHLLCLSTTDELIIQETLAS